MKDELREIVLNLLTDGEEVSDNDGEVSHYQWKVSGDHVDALCKLAGFGGVAGAMDELERQSLKAFEKLQEDEVKAGRGDE